MDNLTTCRELLLRGDRTPILMLNRPDDMDDQVIVAEMQDSSRSMLSAVTGYLALPDENTRLQFTDAVVFSNRLSMISMKQRVRTTKNAGRPSRLRSSIKSSR